MNGTAPQHTRDTYELALDQALHLRGMKRATYVQAIEQDNIRLRHLLKQCAAFVPKKLLNEMDEFLGED